MGFFNTAMVTLAIFTITFNMGDCQRRRQRANPLGPLLQSLMGGNGRACLNDDVAIPANLVASLLQNPQLGNNLNLVAQPRLRQAQPLLETVQPCLEAPQRVIVNPGCSAPKINVPVQSYNVPYQNVPAPVQNIFVPYQSVPVPCQEKAYPCSAVVPQALVSPFLPAASPVSAIAPPTSNLLPPANLNQCRCNFLRKIPIPPPTL